MPSTNVLQIIVVEDDPELLDSLVIGLSAHGFEVRGVCDGADLDAALTKRMAHIVVLDLGLPGEDGLSIAERLQQNPNLGTIMVTARGSTEERIHGLEKGADSYFVKPVDITELAAAIKNLGRRLTRAAKTSWSFNYEASCLRTPNGIKISLTAQECILMNLLFRNLGNTVSRIDIFKALGLPDELFSNPRLEVMISRFRTKILKNDPATSLPLKVRHNMGYVFLTEDSH
jgi:DNA-binding response OmpR family regulator